MLRMLKLAVAVAAVLEQTQLNHSAIPQKASKMSLNRSQDTFTFTTKSSVDGADSVASGWEALAAMLDARLQALLCQFKTRDLACPDQNTAHIRSVLK